MTVLEVINSTTAYFEKAGVESPRLNIEHLLAHSLGKKRLDLYLEFDRPLAESELAPLRDQVKRRASGEPLQHLLGTAEFHGREFLCDTRALIPRPETEQLVEIAIAACPAPSRILDVGTGSGVIVLTLASMLPDATLVATDSSQDALDLAQANAERLGLTERVTFQCCELATGITDTFDLVVANLPYIPSSEIPKLSREVQHDPRQALDGGKDGLALISELSGQLSRLLKPGGTVALEVGFDQAEQVRRLLLEAKCRNIQIHHDLQGVQRFLTANNG